MDKQPNLYERFLKDIHPELINQFNRFIKETDIYKQFIKFAHPEFDKDFKKYTEKMPAYNSYRVARFYVDNPKFPKLYYYLDVGVEELLGKYILLNKEGNPSTMTYTIISEFSPMLQDGKKFHTSEYM